MTRNRHDRVVSHFGEDLDTNVELDGAVLDIPDGTLLHDALALIISSGEDIEEEPVNYADPALGTVVEYHSVPGVPSIVNNVRKLATSTTVNWSADFTPTAGNVLLVFAFRRDAAVVAAASGWAIQVQNPYPGGPSDSVVCYGKISDGTEVSMSYPSATADFVIMEISNANLTDIETNTNTGTLNNPSGTITTGAVTPTAGIPAIIIGASAVAPDEILGHTHTPGSGWAELYQGSGTAHPFEAINYRSVDVASGSYNPTTVCSSSGGDTWRSITISLSSSQSVTLVQENMTQPSVANGSSIAITLAAPVTAGNLLIAMICHRSSSAAITGPAGWTAMTQLSANGFNGGDARFFYKVSNGTEGTSFTFVTTAGARRRYYIAELSGPTGFVDSATTTGSSAGSYNIGLVTPTPGTPSVLIAAMVNSASITGASGYTSIDSGASEAGNGPWTNTAYKSVINPSGDYQASVTQGDNGGLYGGTHVAFSGSTVAWLPGTRIVDEDLDSYHEASSDECMRVALAESMLIYEAIVRMAFSTGTERTYSFYGTNESDYSDLTLLVSTTFTPAGSDVDENVNFGWAAATPYQYYVLVGPSETRKIHELTLHGMIGVVSTNHPLTVHRDLPNQHPADAVTFDDGVAGLGEDELQGAIEKLALNATGGYGVSAIIGNVSTGVKFDLEMPFAGSFSAARLFADQTGSIVVDLWKNSYPNLPPTVADSICGSAKPTISSEIKSQDTTLTGWTTAFDVGDVIRVNVDSAATLTRTTLALRFEPSVSSPAIASVQLGRIDRTAVAHSPTVT